MQCIVDCWGFACWNSYFQFQCRTSQYRFLLLYPRYAIFHSYEYLDLLCTVHGLKTSKFVGIEFFQTTGYTDLVTHCCFHLYRKVDYSVMKSNRYNIDNCMKLLNIFCLYSSMYISAWNIRIIWIKWHLAIYIWRQEAQVVLYWRNVAVPPEMGGRE